MVEVEMFKIGSDRLSCFRQVKIHKPAILGVLHSVSKSPCLKEGHNRGYTSPINALPVSKFTNQNSILTEPLGSSNGFHLPGRQGRFDGSDFGFVAEFHQTLSNYMRIFARIMGVDNFKFGCQSDVSYRQSRILYREPQDKRFGFFDEKTYRNVLNQSLNGNPGYHWLPRYFISFLIYSPSNQNGNRNPKIHTLCIESDRAMGVCFRLLGYWVTFIYLSMKMYINKKDLDKSMSGNRFGNRYISGYLIPTPPHGAAQ